MKKIQLTNVKFADKQARLIKQRKHCVYLGNGVSVYFTDLKAAKSFLVKTNQFLNQKLFELNSLYIDLFTEYRKAWFYFFNVYDRKLHRNSENFVLIEIQTIEKKMTLMVARAHFDNGSTIVFQGFRIILSSMETITETLIDLYKAKKHYAEAHQIRAIQSRIEILKAQINEFGKDMPNCEVYK